MLDLYPEDAGVLTALGTVYIEARQYAPAESAYGRALAADSSSYVAYLNLADVQVLLDKAPEAAVTFERMVKSFPGNAEVEWWRAGYASMLGDYGSAKAHLETYRERSGRNRYSREWAGATLAAIAATEGRLMEAERQLRDAMAAAAEEGNRQRYHEFAQDLATYYVRVLQQPKRALHELDRALKTYPLDSLHPLDRRYVTLAEIHAWAGQPGRARKLLAEYERAVDPRFRRMADNERSPRAVQGELALIEGRPQDAIAEFRQVGARGQCRLCGVEQLARAYASAGQTDSAIAVYERHLSTPWLQRVLLDASELATVYRRLGELYEKRGELAKARQSYRRFVELWARCDAELRPQVTEIRQRLRSLDESLLRSISGAPPRIP